MKLVTFSRGGAAHLGALLPNDAVLDLTKSCAGVAYSSMQALIEAGEEAWARARKAVAHPEASALHDRRDVKLLAPLPRPIRLRDCCLFLEHMERAMAKLARMLADAEPDPAAAHEALMATGKYTLKPIFKSQVIYYNADNLAISGPDDEIPWPAQSKWMDYELEWACVVGRTGRDITPENARSHIFGYTIFNDWSARDIQLAVMDVNLGPGEGKDIPGNGLGPCIVTADELTDPYNLTMTALVNGEEWSRGSTATMHHSFEDAIVQFSRGKTLHAGEVIGSGTVLSGCGFELGRRLAPGDAVQLEIENIGILRNRLGAAQPQ
ncbi:MAG: fumarylacetoacetate hydrolase family protein [Rhodospirillaceae bacterium]|nr:fumarylacetoacetate hydrolase family protein [Rhodospirillaceae bacterium]